MFEKIFCELSATSAERSKPSGPRRARVIMPHFPPPELPGVQELRAAVQSMFEKGAFGLVEVYSEYTGLGRYPGADGQGGLLALDNEKSSRRNVDPLRVVGPCVLPARECVSGHPPNAFREGPELLGPPFVFPAPLALGSGPRRRRIDAMAP